MDTNYITLAICEEIATVTINRPQQYNALTTPAFIELKQVIDACASNPSLAVVILTGAGKAFSAGGDLSDFRQRIADGVFLDQELIRAAGECALAIRNSPIPVIAMINGSAAGAGCGLALACDFRVMSANAKLVTAFIDVAAPGDTCTLYFLGKMLGASQLVRFAMLSEAIGASDALALGLAYDVAAPEELSSKTWTLAKKLSSKPRGALVQQKDYINRFLFPDLSSVVSHECRTMTACSRLPDFTEAVSAFLEKRPPAFTHERLTDLF